MTRTFRTLDRKRWACAYMNVRIFRYCGSWAFYKYEGFIWCQRWGFKSELAAVRAAAKYLGKGFRLLRKEKR